jgi:hypothetical protein
MIQSDESFRDEFKPLSIPASYESADTQESKIIFALAQLGEGSADDVLARLEELQPGSADPQLAAMTEVVLSGLFNKGLIKGTDHSGKMSYNLSKITKSNEGEVNPNLLAPGLD